MSEKTVLITGSSSGFGRLLVSAFLRQGWRVLATLRQAESRLDLFRDEMQQAAGRLAVLSLDLTKETDRRAVADAIATRYSGRLDCLVNNAGFGLFGALEDLSESQVREQMEVNFFGLLLLTRELLPYLRWTRGRIINLSSLLGYAAMPLAPLYCASKFAVEGLSESLYYELKPHGVQVAMVEPGGFRTSFTQNQAWGEGCFAENSPYLTQTQNYQRFRDRRASGPGTPPDPVINAVLRLASTRKMPLRVRCGKDARLIYAVKRLLPERWQTALFAAFYKRLFARPAAAS